MIRAGYVLREERQRLGLSIDQVEKATKIRASFIVAIEKGEYTKLPSSVYVSGFVKNYAQFLGLPQRETLALFRREFSEKEFTSVLPKGLSKKENIAISGFRFGQTAVVILFILFLLVGYIGFEYRYAFLNPPLEVLTPSENVILSSQTVQVAGKTDPNAAVYVNGALTSLDPGGNFEKNITEFSGKATIKIKAVNKFGKVTEIERHVEIKGE